MFPEVPDQFGESVMSGFATRSTVSPDNFRRSGPKRLTLVLGSVLALLVGCIAMASAPASATDAVLANVSASIAVGSSPRDVVVNSDG